MAHPTVRLIAVALLASTALVACKKKDDTVNAVDTAPGTPASSVSLPSSPPPAPAPSTATPPAATAISDVQLGNAVGTDNRVGSPSTSFGTKDTLYASVAVPASTTGTLGARWLYLGTDGAASPTVVDTQSKSLTGGGATNHEFHISKPDGWPAGKYRVEINQDGRVVQTRDFDVR